uniref:Acetylcholine receptor gamma subunit n=1 Tax=Callorhinchus milii TaxID=7868 RepID=V9KTW6_CALMI
MFAAILLSLSLCSEAVWGVNQEERLFKTLMSNYNPEIRPSKSYSDIIDVHLKLILTNLISLNEKEETLTTNVWIEIQWQDYRLVWNQTDYEDLSLLRIPSSLLWLPDIVLENNIDGQFEIAYYANVLVYSTGDMYWLPPAIYRSTCSVGVTYFPFDWQNCSLVFRSQTYNAREINLKLTTEDNDKVIEWIEIDPAAFTENGEWAIKHKPAKKLLNPRFTEDDTRYQEVVFFLIIQRKPLFYIINILIPCVLISSLDVLVYFLPAQAGGQKCTLSISVLLAQTIFVILIAQKVPETSLNVPLIGKYLTFVMFVALLIVTNCVIVLNVSLRTPNTHSISKQIKHVFLEVLPPYLGMHLELSEDLWEVPQGKQKKDPFDMKVKVEEYVLKTPRSEMMFECERHRHGLKRLPFRRAGHDIDIGTTVELFKSLAHCVPEIKDCVDACNFIAQSTKDRNDVGSENESWNLIGKVIDKACFWLAIVLFTVGTVAIFLTPHFNRPPEFPFPGDPQKYTPE